MSNSIFNWPIFGEAYIWAWGRNNKGQVFPNTDSKILYPHQLPIKGNFVNIEGGYLHSVALREDGTVWTFGENKYGSLGNLKVEDSNLAQKVVLRNGDGLEGIVQIVSVGYHTLALNSEGDVYSWGSNDFGELGHFNNKIQRFAEKIKGLKNIKNIAVGWHHSIALNKDGKLFIWGSDPAYQIKETTPVVFDSITLVTGIPKMDKIACGSWHSLAIDSSGQVWGWGRNHFGMLGTGDTISVSMPMKIEGITNACEIGGGCFQSLIIDENGKTWTFGDNPSGQQGQGNHTRLYHPKLLSSPLNKKRYKKDIIKSLNDAEKKEDTKDIIFLKFIKYGLLFSSLTLNVFLYLRLRKRKVKIKEA